MIVSSFTDRSDRAAIRYGTLIDAWRGLYLGAINSPRFGDESTIASALSQAESISETWFSAEADQIFEDSRFVAYEARRVTLETLGSNDEAVLTDAMHDHFIESIDFITREIETQIDRDVAQLRDALRRARLVVSLAAQSESTTYNVARMLYRVGNTFRLEFYFHDRRHRRLASRKFVRQLYRHHLLTLYNEIVLMTLVEHGQRFARVAHVDNNAKKDGMIVALAPNTVYPTYLEIRDDVFHPNAGAVLEPIPPEENA